VKPIGTEAFLRRHNLIDPDDQVIESVAGQFVTTTLEGVEQPMPQGRLMIGKMPRSFKLCHCTYSSRRLFFGLPANVGGTHLHWLWRAETSGTTLTAVFNSSTLQMVRWKPALNADEVAAFAARLLAQRDLRIAELPPETRQQVEYWSAQLDRRGALDAALAGPVPEPRTVMGALLRAMLRGEVEKQHELEAIDRQNGGRPDDLAVVQAAFEQLARRLAGAKPDAPVAARIAAVDLTNEQGSPVNRAQRREMIKQALAEAVPLLGSGQDQQTTLLVIAQLSKELDLCPMAMDWLAVRSEQQAFDQGLNPSLLPDG